MYKVIYKIIFTNLAIILCLVGGEAFALSSENRPHLEVSKVKYQSGITKRRATGKPWATLKLAKENLRSRSDVMNEVKKRYEAKVLKISLNSHTGIYHVRILLPNGKVRSVQISRKR